MFVTLKKRISSKISIVSCFLSLKNVLINLLCVFWIEVQKLNERNMIPHKLSHIEIRVSDIVSPDMWYAYHQVRISFASLYLYKKGCRSVKPPTP